MKVQGIMIVVFAGMMYVNLVIAGDDGDNGCHNDKLYIHGQAFKDGCDLCVCQDGHVDCKEASCSSLDCNYKDRLYLDGQTFQESCNTCLCHEGHVECTDSQCT